jgi:dTDP-4-dehydrorhamnose 3,5-epimerase
MNKPKLYKGGISEDSRGSVSYNNNLKLKKIRRFYVVKNKKKNFIRAWHGHKIEAKFIMCIEGKAKIAAVRINNFKNPSRKSKPYYFNLDSKKSDVIYIPPGFANGSKSITKNMKLYILSTTTLEKSLKDDFRFPINFWTI